MLLTVALSVFTLHPILTHVVTSFTQSHTVELRAIVSADYTCVLQTIHRHNISKQNNAVL